MKNINNVLQLVEREGRGLRDSPSLPNILVCAWQMEDIMWMQPPWAYSLCSHTSLVPRKRGRPVGSKNNKSYGEGEARKKDPGKK